MAGRSRPSRASALGTVSTAWPRTGGAFGAGWSSMLDMSAAPGLVNSAGTQQTVVVTYPDGQQVAFGANADGSYTPPRAGSPSWRRSPPAGTR